MLTIYGRHHDHRIMILHQSGLSVTLRLNLQELLSQQDLVLKRQYGMVKGLLMMSHLRDKSTQLDVKSSLQSEILNSLFVRRSRQRVHLKQGKVQ